jgi:hypothetical protein
MLTLDQAIEKNNTFMEKFNPALESFVAKIQLAMDEYMTRNCPILPRVVITMERGMRYVRIVKGQEDGSHRSVHSFVDKTNGDILKGSWKSPVKNGVRGSIFNDDCMQGMSHHGPEYLR